MKRINRIIYLIIAMLGLFLPDLFSQIKPDLILVEGGTYQMGNPTPDPKKRDNDDEAPIHSVTVGSFYIGKFEVTVKEYKAYIASDATLAMPSAPDAGFWEDHPDSKKFYPLPTKTWWGWADDMPMQKVSWEDAILYCNWLSEKEGLEKCYKKNKDFGWDTDVSKNGYRLPTEAEWEFAAKGGKLSKGYKFAGSNDYNEVAWVDETTKEASPMKIGTKKPNELGIFDMSGNVWEWCSDYYLPNYYAQCAKQGTVTNPFVNFAVEFRVSRGGGWYYKEDYATLTSRDGPKYAFTSFALGFRLARTKK
jgi:sulfatase modifying factor 1